MHKAMFSEFGHQLAGFARLALGALLMSGGVVAHAQSTDPNVYVGAGVVFVDISTGPGTTSACNLGDCDQEADFGLMFGYELGRFAALEVGYYKTDGSVFNRDITNTSCGSGSQWDASTFYLAGIGRVPLGGTAFALTGRIGGHTWDNDGTGCFDVDSREKDGVGVLYGLGLDADLTESVRFQATWTDYPTEDDVFNRQVVGANLVVRF